MKRYKKLTKKELAQLAERVRSWPEGYKATGAALFRHLKALEQDNADLQKEISELKQADFFRKAQELKATPVEVKPKEPVRKYPLPERLALMTPGSKEWALTLKMNGLRDEQALDMVREFQAGPLK